MPIALPNEVVRKYFFVHAPPPNLNTRYLSDVTEKWGLLSQPNRYSILWRYWFRILASLWFRGEINVCQCRLFRKTSRRFWQLNVVILSSREGTAEMLHIVWSLMTFEFLFVFTVAFILGIWAAYYSSGPQNLKGKHVMVLHFWVHLNYQFCDSCSY